MMSAEGGCESVEATKAYISNNQWWFGKVDDVRSGAAACCCAQRKGIEVDD